MALSHSPKIVKDGLVLCLDAANKKSYPGSGTTWTDLSGNGNNFTINGPDFVSGSAAHFSFLDNQSDYIARSNTDVIGGLTSITIDMWIRIDTLSTFPIISYAAGANFQDAADNDFLIFRAGANSLYIYKRNVQTVSYPDSYYNIGNFINFVFTREINNIKIFTNTVKIVESSSHFTEAYDYGGTLLFGQEQDSPGGGFSSLQDFIGDISVCKIYNRALSQDEITQNFNALRGRYGI